LEGGTILGEKEELHPLTTRFHPCNLTLTIERRLFMAREAPHDFTLQYPPGRDFFKSNFAVTLETPAGGAAGRDMVKEHVLSSITSKPSLAAQTTGLGVYLHIPFCERKW
jgi:hypothetical protein